jgi:RNA polymerase primary sigma factor
MLEKEGPETPPDSPPLDRSNASVKALVRAAKKRGYVTHDQINSLMKEVNSEHIENVLAMFSKMGINVVESEEAETEEATEEAREEPEEEESEGETRRGRRHGAGRDQEVRARRAHRRSRAPVYARDGFGRAALPRG